MATQPAKPPEPNSPGGTPQDLRGLLTAMAKGEGAEPGWRFAQGIETNTQAVGQLVKTEQADAQREYNQFAKNYGDAAAVRMRAYCLRGAESEAIAQEDRETRATSRTGSSLFSGTSAPPVTPMTPLLLETDEAGCLNDVLTRYRAAVGVDSIQRGGGAGRGKPRRRPRARRRSRRSRQAGRRSRRSRRAGRRRPTALSRRRARSARRRRRRSARHRRKRLRSRTRRSL